MHNEMKAFFLLFSPLSFKTLEMNSKRLHQADRKRGRLNVKSVIFHLQTVLQSPSH